MSSFQRATVASKLAAVHSRAADLVERQAKLTLALDAFFSDVEEAKALLKAEGSLWAGPVLDPPVEAAYGLWLSRGPKETRIELERLGEAPLGALSVSPALSHAGDHG